MLRSLLPQAMALGLVGVAVAGCSSQPLEVGPGGDDAATADQGGGVVSPGDSYVPVAYPSGPYGAVVGSTVANLEFLGWHSPLAANYDPAQFEKVRLSDFYNPDGASTKPKLLMINASAVWCTVCRAEYRQLHEQNIYNSYRPQGVEIVGALFEDQDYAAAKPEDLQLWGEHEQFAVEFPMVLDPGFKLGRYFASDVTPLNMMIETRTMTIVDVTMGYDPNPDSTYWLLVDEFLAEM